MPLKAATTLNCSFATKLKSINASANGGRFDCRATFGNGSATLIVSGNNATELFAPEAGGHRIQRIPPTERNGRRHSSTITVAVITGQQAAVFNERDVSYRYCVASVGAGGQNRQKNETACVAIHSPTGIEAKCEDERSQARNRAKALAVLRKRVLDAQQSAAHQSTNSNRKSQIGCGERADKIRTVQLHNGVVTNHLTGTKMRAERYLKGFIEDIQS